MNPGWRPDICQVLFMDPEALIGGGARVWCPDRRCHGPHAFVCAHTGDRSGLWVPLYSRPGPGRFEIPVAGRYGHPKWVRGVWHYHEKQAWVVPHGVAADSARAAGDMSRPGSWNMLIGFHAKVTLVSGAKRIELVQAAWVLGEVPA